MTNPCIGPSRRHRGNPHRHPGYCLCYSGRTDYRFLAERIYNRDRIVVHSSILRIARTDAQLALVLGHELAHANLGHLDKQWANQVLGWAGGAAIDAGLVLGGISTGGIFTRQFARAGALAYSVSFEREADYVGAYYAARAGYDLIGAEEIWRALSLESPDDIRVGRTHPVTPVRFVQMQKVIAEIA
jgi:predicted Zn-dependent protease